MPDTEDETVDMCPECLEPLDECQCDEEEGEDDEYV